MFSMCQKLFKALSMYDLPRPHNKQCSGIQSQAVSQAPKSEVFYNMLPPQSGFQLFFKTNEEPLWGKLYCVHVCICGGEAATLSQVRHVPSNNSQRTYSLV